MRAFFAALYKDIRLFLSGAGLLALLLPLLLLPALSLGVEDLSSARYLSSFPIAVRDEDGTVMSRSLITQLQAVELFSEVRVLDGSTTDAQAVADGAAAVATIPKDFFYEVYRMADCPIHVTLNSEKPAQSAVFEAIFRAVMGIIRANHASALGAYTFVYGELTPELTRQMRAETGDRLVVDALGRQRVFESMVESADLAGALLRRLAACVLGVLALFFAVCTAKTVPEELKLGVVPRIRALGLGLGGFTASKFLSALILSLPVVLLTSALTDLGLLPILALYTLLLLAAFGAAMLLAALTPGPASAQRWANLLLLLSLALGGTLWPVDGLPGPLRALRRAALPYYAHQGLEALAAGLRPSDLCRLLWPPALAAAVLLPAALLLFSRPRPGRSAPRRRSGGAGIPADPPALLSTPARLLRLTALRLRHVTGSPAYLAAALAAALLCGASAASLSSGAAGTLRLAAVDLDGTQLSRELLEQIAAVPGVTLRRIDAEDADLALITGRYEGVLTVGAGYGAALREDGDTPLDFRAAASAVSSQGAREIVAGAVLIQQRSFSAVADAQRLAGRTLTEADILRLRQTIADCGRTLPDLYHITYSAGSAPADPFAPRSMAFAALTCLFTLLTAASFRTSRDAKMARRRLRAMAHGPALSVLPDLLALAALGALTALAVLIPSGLTARQLLAALATALCMASLALLLTRFSAAGRVDALAPILALLICLLGGCFLNTSGLSPALSRLTLLSPAGLSAAAESSAPCLLALLAEGAVFAALAAGSDPFRAAARGICAIRCRICNKKG